MIDRFAAAKRELPYDAILWARENWRIAGPALIALTQDYVNGCDRSDRAADAVFFAIFMFADRADTSAFPVLCAMARDPGTINRALDDGITVALKRIVTQIWGGDLAQLTAVIDDNAAEPFSRAAFIDAYAHLMLTGAIVADDARAYLRGLYEAMDKSEDAGIVWDAWAQAYLSTGAGDAIPLIEKAVAADWIDISIADADLYRKERERYEQDHDRFVAEQVANAAPLTDMLVELSTWYAFSGEAGDDDRDARGANLDLDKSEHTPAVNPYRDVGRNSPCPCGSGLKFKKCCLPDVEQGNFLP